MMWPPAPRWSSCADPAPDLAESHPRPALARSAGPQHDLVAVVEEGVLTGVGLDRLGAIPAQLQEAAPLVPGSTGDGAGAVQVTGPQLLTTWPLSCTWTVMS